MILALYLVFVVLVFWISILGPLPTTLMEKRKLVSKAFKQTFLVALIFSSATGLGKEPLRIMALREEAWYSDPHWVKWFLTVSLFWVWIIFWRRWRHALKAEKVKTRSIDEIILVKENKNGFLRRTMRWFQRRSVQLKRWFSSGRMRLFVFKFLQHAGEFLVFTWIFHWIYGFFQKPKKEGGKL